MPLTTTNWQDVLDPRFKEIFDAEYTNATDKVGDYYAMEGSKLLTERYSQTGALPEMGAFSGQVSYVEAAQGYDTTATHVQFAQGIQIERLLQDFDQHGSIMAKPRLLADSINTLRNVHRVRPFVNAFSVDTYFYNNTEGVALCSNSHTTTSGASTTNGFDNLVTTSLSATSFFSARLQMQKHRNDQGIEINVMPDLLYAPVDLEEIAFEIVNSTGKLDTANNNVNFNRDKVRVVTDLWFSTRGDTNDWFLIDSKLMKRWGLKWIDHVKGEFKQIEEFDTLIGKWRAYAVWTQAVVDWRWITGANVS